eukprot:TRINITY_DN3766_c0_g1_i13.p3 TRINITY_DN3766_c0_g1~~TRINITY_DN3766_c0_g1_i13.p3  ORF type:complete len:102 (-),score=9.48 TRINITY_DN3766_c0_g1_i13:824-1129(-)
MVVTATLNCTKPRSFIIMIPPKSYSKSSYDDHASSFNKHSSYDGHAGSSSSYDDHSYAKPSDSAYLKPSYAPTRYDDDHRKGATLYQNNDLKGYDDNDYIS